MHVTTERAQISLQVAEESLERSFSIFKKIRHEISCESSHMKFLPYFPKKNNKVKSTASLIRALKVNLMKSSSQWIT